MGDTNESKKPEDQKASNSEAECKHCGCWEDGLPCCKCGEIYYDENWLED